MPVLCMDCCTVSESALIRTVSGSSVGAAEATVDVVALGSAGAFVSYQRARNSLGQ